MHIVMIDDSIPFDGLMPTTRPLGGAEKAFASLAGGLVRGGHTVEVFNHCHYAMAIEGAKWHPWDDPVPLECDLLIAFRKPELLGKVRKARHRLLWVTAHPRYLDLPPHRKWLDSLDATLVFVSELQQQAYVGDRRSAVVAPGVRWDYLRTDPMRPAEPPRAVTTAHPLHGLDWLIDQWVGRIRPRCGAAELHVYSGLVAKGLNGEAIPENTVPVVEKVLRAREYGVVPKMPDGDLYMADDYLAARVHLYPGHPEDFGAWTLLDTQALGLPAVARGRGATPERMVNGMTGYIVPDDEAFANLAVQMLSDDAVFNNVSEDARETQRGRDWNVAARDFVALADDAKVGAA